MRMWAAVSMLAVSFVIFAGASAQAAAWCAWFTGYDYSHDCGYYTLEQCSATVRGVGGYCSPNAYAPPPYPPPPYRKSKKPRRHG
jgi:hypothetical protein